MPKINIYPNGETTAGSASDFHRDAIEVTIGRLEENDIVISSDPSVSTKHGVIKRIFGGHLLEDLNSSNGTYFQGARMKEIMIEDGEEYFLGNTKLIFTYSEEEQAFLANERLQKTDGLDIDKETTSAEPPVVKAAPRAQPRLITASTPPSDVSFETYTPRMTYQQENPLLPLLNVIGIMFFFALGLGGGFYLKHKQTYNSGLMKDYQEGKIRFSLFEKFK